jgi:cysteine desulfurase/selenocysteine lyase
MDRRSFLKLTAATASVASLNNKSFAAPTPLTPTAEDEAYWSLIRDEFPITKNVLYFNNGTMGPSPLMVTDRVTERIRHVDATGDYGGDYEGIKNALAKMIGADSGDRMAYTHNVSEAISIVSSGIDMKAGDEVILTSQEHAGNSIPWLARKNRDGIVVKIAQITDANWLPLSDDQILDNIKALITPKTRAMSIPHLTCTTGHLLPIKRISELAKKHHIWLLVDGAHPPGMIKVDVKDLGCDAYASCGHKWMLGPKGVGWLYISQEFSDHVIPTWSGGEADKKWDTKKSELEFLPTASKYDFATQNFALFDGLMAAIEFQNKIGVEKIDARVKHLTTMFRNGLKELAPGRYKFLTPESSLTGITSIKLDKMDYKEFATKMWDKKKIRTRIVPEGELAANRFSVHIYTSEADVQTFIDTAKEVLA